MASGVDPPAVPTISLPGRRRGALRARHAGRTAAAMVGALMLTFAATAPSLGRPVDPSPSPQQVQRITDGRDYRAQVKGSGTTTPSAGGRWVMGYYTGYHTWNYPLSAIDWSAMTHIAVACVIPVADGSLNETFFQDPGQGPAWAKSVVDEAHRHGVKAILMVGGSGNHDPFAAAINPARRATFVRNLVAAVDRYGFDGLDLDFEPLNIADEPDLTALMRELKAARPGMLLTLPVAWINARFPQWSLPTTLPTMLPYLDQVNIMSYDMSGSWSGWTSWHGSALYGEHDTAPVSVASSVKAYLGAGVPRSKLGFGIGFYGLCYVGVTGPRQTSPTMVMKASDNYMAYSEIMDRYYSPAVARWDDTAQMPYLSSTTPMGPQGCTYVSYEDPRSIAAKGAYAKEQGLGGVIIWAINEGYRVAAAPDRRDELMAATKAAFRG